MDTHVTALIESQPDAAKSILKKLRQIILNAAPHVEEAIKYKLPFYAYKGRLCYLNIRKQEVHLDICKGPFLSNEQGVSEGNGKEVRIIKMAYVEAIR